MSHSHNLSSSENQNDKNESYHEAHNTEQSQLAALEYIFFYHSFSFHLIVSLFNNGGGLIFYVWSRILLDKALTLERYLLFLWLVFHPLFKKYDYAFFSIFTALGFRVFWHIIRNLIFVLTRCWQGKVSVLVIQLLARWSVPIITVTNHQLQDTFTPYKKSNHTTPLIRQLIGQLKQTR